MSLWHLTLIGTGGAVGAVLRYGVAQWFAARRRLPIYATLIVNWAGSLAIGVLIGSQLMDDNPELYAWIGTGVLGGLTTYSTLNVQKATLAREAQGGRLVKYVAGTYIGGWLLTAAGIGLGRIFLLST